MQIKEQHKPLLKKLGLKEEDFDRFDGKFVRYEYHDKKGVRLYDPYYRTSYKEYIDIDGWSAWSQEKDTFMSDIMKGVHEGAGRAKASGPKPNQEKITESLQKKFGRADNSEKDNM